MAKKIPLQNGMFAIVDEEDYERCVEYKWLVYKSRNTLQVANTNNLTLSRFILNCKDKNRFASRKDTSVLDFRKINLINVDRRTMLQMRRGNSGTSSKYKGVSWNKRLQRWKAYIRINRKQKHLGYFAREKSAAAAYNKSAIDIFGEHAFVNKINENNNVLPQKIEKQAQYRGENRTGFKGVSEKGNGWQASIGHNYKSIYLGYFDTKDQAAKAYDEEAYEIYGERAMLNFPELIEEYKKAIE